MNQLEQHRSLCESALALSATKVRKKIHTFFIQTMIIYATTFNRVNFSQMGRLFTSGEQRFRQNFEKDFDWITFNRFYLSILPQKRSAIAIDPSYISKSGKCTPGIAYFWSGAAGMAKRGLEILGFAVVDADSNDAIALCDVTRCSLILHVSVLSHHPDGWKGRDAFPPSRLAHTRG